MDITLVGINFAPEVTGIGRYMTAYAGELHDAGHRVTVVTGLPHYPGWRTFPWDDQKHPFRVERCAHYVPAQPSASRRVLYELSFAISVARKLRSLPRPDLILAVSPTLASAWVAARRASSLGVPFALLVQDLVSAAVEQSGTAGSLARNAASILERSTMRRASRVGVIHEGMRGAVRRLGAPEDAISLVANWTLDPDRPFPPRAAARGMLGFREDEIVCVHAGNMGAKQGLEVAVDAARIADATGARVRFLLVGDGNQRETLQRRAEGVRTVEFWPLQQEDRFRALLSGADVLLLTQRPEVEDMAYPSKLLEYERSGTPIVAAVSRRSAAGFALRAAEGAVLIPPGEPRLLLETVIETGQRTDGSVESAAANRRLIEPEGARAIVEFVAAAGRAELPSGGDLI